MFMAEKSKLQTNIPRDRFDFAHQPETDQSFENALEKARNGGRLTVADGVELMTTGTDQSGIDRQRKEAVLEAADRRRADQVGEEVSFVANINNNVTTACNTGCLFCNFKDRSEQFRSNYQGNHGGFTKTPQESHNIVSDALEKGIYEVTSVSGLHPAFALDDEHREILEDSDRGDLNYRSPTEYEKSPGTYRAQIDAMNVGDVHVHSMTPEEAYHARRGTEWGYPEIYTRLQKAGLDSVPGTAAEILVDEVRSVICPGKISTEEWLEVMLAATNVGLPITSTIMYGHIENEMHRVLHLERIRDLQDNTGKITEFVPLSFVHQETPLYERGMVYDGASDAEDELMIAVARLFLDNIDHIQSSWVKFGNEKGLKLLSCGANDFMGTILSEEITKRAGGGYGEHRTFQDYVEMITAIGRIPVERSTDYQTVREIDLTNKPYGPVLGPKADGTPMVYSM